MTDPDPDHDTPAVAEAIRNRHPVFLETATWKATAIGSSADPEPTQ